MKSTKIDEPKSKFPKLQIAVNGNIFLMSNKTPGVCVYSVSGNWLGEHNNNLFSGELTDFNGSITLEN